MAANLSLRDLQDENVGFPACPLSVCVEGEERTNSVGWKKPFFEKYLDGVLRFRFVIVLHSQICFCDSYEQFSELDVCTFEREDE